MNNPLHDIDKLFRDGIEGRSEYPPKNVWDNIESELDKKTAIRYKRKYNSLKRKTLILLFLFLGFVFYEVVNRFQQKENADADQHDGVTSENLLPVNADNFTQTEEISLPVREDNVDLKKGESSKMGPLPAVTNSLREEIVKDEIVQANIEPRNAAEAIRNEQKAIAVYQAINSRDNKEFTIESRATGDVENAHDNSNTPHSYSTAANSMTSYPDNLLKRLSSFTMIASDDSWEKDFINSRSTAMISPVQLSAKNTVAQNSKNRADGRSRFSLAFQFSTSGNWNTIKEDESHHRRRGGSGGGNNGGGNNGGGNNGGGNNGGGNAGGNNSGGTNNSGGNWGGHDDDRHELNNGEYNRLAYIGGVNLSYAVSKRLSLQTGLKYQQNVLNIKDKMIYADKDNSGKVSYLLNCSAGYIKVSPPARTNPNVRDSIMVSNTRNFSSYLGIPLSVEYRVLSSGKFSLAASTGGQVSILVNGKTKTVLGAGTSNETRETGKTMGLKPSYFSVLTSITGAMRLNKNISLSLAPAAQYGLTYVNTKRSVKTRSNYLGLTAGLKLRL